MAKADSELDFVLIARNVRHLRMAHGWTQAELAHRGGIDPATVYRLEGGRRVHRRSLEKIGDALQRPLSMLNSHSSFEPTRPMPGLYIQRDQEWIWHTLDDHRPQIPEDSHLRIQAEAERLRLGRSGLVSMFAAFSFAMPRGPGMTMYEVFGRVQVGPLRTYRDGALFCLRGEVSVTVRERPFRLGPGDSLGFSEAFETFLEPHEPVKGSGLPPRVLHIGASRVGRLPSQD